MKSTNTLPEGYKEYYSINLQQNKKTALLVNLLALLISVAMIVPMCFFVPFFTVFDTSNGIIPLFIRTASLIFLLIAYIILHELVHGIAMKICGTKKVKYGFTGMYAFAGSDDYYGKGAYIFIALAPVVLWGIVLAVINFLVPTEWIWIIYLIQITNISGAAGDFWVTAKFSSFPKEILIRDCGVGMTVYSLSDFPK